MWWHYMDMYSGGSRKTAYDSIYVEAADERQSSERFTEHTGRYPSYVTCSCCGPDYGESGPFENLAEASHFSRGCAYDRVSGTYQEIPAEPRGLAGPYTPLDEYLKRANVLVLPLEETA